MTRVASLVTLVWLAAAPAWAQQAPEPPAPITLEEIERLALEQHPALPAATAAVEAARADARQAGAWPNPTIGYEGEELGGRAGRGAHGAFVEQTIPLGGKLRLSREAFEAGISEAEQRVARARLRVLTGARVAYLEVLAGQLRVDVRERLARLATEATVVSAQLFNVGAADRPDVLASEMEASLVRLELVEARNELARAWRHLAIAIGQPTMPQRPVAGTLDTPLPELPRDETLRAALAASPDLAAARAAIVRAEREVAVAKRETFPDLTLRGGPSYERERAEEDGRRIGLEWSVEAGVSVPLFNRNRGGIAAAEARLVEARLAVRTLELELEERFAELFGDYLTALRRAEALRAEVLPRADEAYRLYLAKYREMAAAYPQVLITQRALFEVTDRYLDAVERVRVSAEQLQNLLAGDPASKPMTARGESR